MAAPTSPHRRRHLSSTGGSRFLEGFRQAVASQWGEASACSSSTSVREKAPSVGSLGTATTSGAHRNRMRSPRDTPNKSLGPRQEWCDTRPEREHASKFIEGGSRSAL